MSDLETRLLEFWKADAPIWRERTRTVWEIAGRELSKIDIAKQRSQLRRLVNEKRKRIADGSLIRKIRGTMKLAENSDRLCSPMFECVVCGAPFAAAKRVRRTPLYCSSSCNATAYRMRQALNG